ncbi:hypothetical protein NPIL_690281 [Nephila pilipes]|uniref:Uncharacterized protein n=1 Tax=Nephila pilipes TaxID=299642 RepID=A0A8X6PB21_NEPPI|nr:hypothetical protein NPIL_690281 [Nephila pilipes]
MIASSKASLVSSVTIDEEYSIRSLSRSMKLSSRNLCTHHWIPLQYYKSSSYRGNSYLRIDVAESTPVLNRNSIIDSCRSLLPSSESIVNRRKTILVPICSQIPKNVHFKYDYFTTPKKKDFTACVKLFELTSSKIMNT